MRILLLTIAVLALANPAGATECIPTTTNSGVVQAGPYYVYDCLLDDTPQGDQECWFPGPWAIWIYEETNGIDGLQRADEIRDDTCGGQIAGDTVIF